LAVGDILVKVCVDPEERVEDGWVERLSVDMEGTIDIKSYDLFDRRRNTLLCYFLLHLYVLKSVVNGDQSDPLCFCRHIQPPQNL
jgi:hypothetical protein